MLWTPKRFIVQFLPPDYKRLELPDNFTVSECAVDSVTKFTSLIRARD